MFKQAIFKYLNRFGLFSGLKLFFKIRRSRKGEVIFLKIPRLEHLLQLRRHDSDLQLFNEIFINNEYKQQELGNDIRYIVDAGANIGLSTLYFKRRYPQSEIIAIEPEKTNYDLLLKNTVGYAGIQTLQRGLWNSVTDLVISNPQAASWEFETEQAVDEINAVSSLSVNEILTEYDFPRIDLLKMDIEGAERKVFYSNIGWMCKVRFMLIEIHEDAFPGTLELVYSAAHAAGFTATAQGTVHFFHR